MPNISISSWEDVPSLFKCVLKYDEEVLGNLIYHLGYYNKQNSIVNWDVQYNALKSYVLSGNNVDYIRIIELSFQFNEYALWSDNIKLFMNKNYKKVFNDLSELYDQGQLLIYFRIYDDKGELLLLVDEDAFTYDVVKIYKKQLDDNMLLKICKLHGQETVNNINEILKFA